LISLLEGKHLMNSHYRSQLGRTREAVHIGIGVLLLAVLLLSAVGARAAPAADIPSSAPSVAEFDEYLIVGMRPGAAGEAVTIGSSNEIGADRAVTTSNNNYGLQHPAETPASDGTLMFGEGTRNNVYPTITYANGTLQGNELTGGPGSG
jgi:hypothetical protein